MTVRKKTTEEAPKNANAVLPPSVNVNGYDVMIRPMTGNEENWSGAGGTYNWGQINLSLDSPPQRVAMCLVHELIHACFDHSGLRYKYQNYGGQDIEEEIVSSLGFALAKMIGTETKLVDFVRAAFENKPIEIPEECMQIPIGGNWVTSAEANHVFKTRKPSVQKKVTM